ncbi:serine hydrolase domain-containing protein [Streptosporangium sp. NPDC023825]|uniref:serine hydrolase domain-containing protein n=1 Tax=Streptosporangium sp. NPDC023825 TaxID=3154909 RepID=UPI003415CAE6
MTAVLAGVMIAVVIGSGGAQPVVTDGAGASLQAGVDAVHRAGAVGVLAEVRDGSGRAAARNGVAELKGRTPVPWGGYFRIGSTTKTFTAVVLLQLVGEGRLKLTDTVEHWLPGVVGGNGNDGRRITVKNLLRHTSGLNDWNGEVPIAKDPTPQRYLAERFRLYRPERQVELATRKPPMWTPDPGDPAGERRWAYSNTNYTLAGMIVEKVTGNPLEHEVHERIIAPLGLRHTTTGATAYVPYPHARAYLQFPGRTDLTDTTVMADGGSGDGGMISTTGDVTTFFRALLAGRLLRPSELAEMKDTVAAEDYDGTPGTRYGLGLAWRPVPGCAGGVWSHHGNSPGMGSRNGVTGDGRTAIAMFVSTQRTDERQLRQDTAARELIDDTLCGAGS